MTYAIVAPYDFARDGRANRRDADATPRTLITSIIGGAVCFHVAGDTHLRMADITAAAEDGELVAGMDPEDAFRLGIEHGKRGEA